MDIYVKESDMPIKCRKCFCITTDSLSTRCKPLNVDLGSGAYYERLPNCPLKVIEQWRLESCATCGEQCSEGYQDGSFGMTCENWKAIDGTTEKL